MLRAIVQWGSMALAVALAASLLGASPSLAAGFCGADFTGPTACPVTTSGPVSGTLGATNENDYFVFFAVKRTKLTLSVTDEEQPTCSILDQPTPVDCGSVFVYLNGARGNNIATSTSSYPAEGVPATPAVLSRTVAPGTYYAVVSGTVIAAPPPYSLDVNGSPNVQWPAPCIVPKLRKNTSVRRTKSLLALHHCSAGRMRGVRSGSVRRGDVVGLRPRAGTVAPYGARVGILVSR